MPVFLFIGGFIILLFIWIALLGGPQCEGCETSKRGKNCTCYENESGYRW